VISIETRKQIKLVVLKALESAKKNARKGACYAITAIAQIELPRKEWSEIITTLCNNAQGSNINLKLSSLEALGYISEDLDNKTLDISQIDMILNALVLNATEAASTNEVKLISLSSLSKCLHLSGKNFNDPNEKNILMTKIISCINSTNTDIKVQGLQCIMEIVKCFYDLIGGSTLEQIGYATFPLIKQDCDESIGKPAVEIWSSICNIEIDREEMKDPKFPVRKYISTAHKVFVPILLECLKTKSEESEEDWNMAATSGHCLSLIAEIIRDEITAPVIDFVTKNIGSTEWICKKAAMFAFGSILNGPKKDTLNPIVNSALPSLIKILHDENALVRESTAWAFEKISKYTYDCLKIPQIFKPTATELLLVLKDLPKISNQICFTFVNLAYSLRPAEGQPTCLMSCVFREALQALWENAFRTDAFEEGLNLACTSFAAFTNIIQYSATDAIPVIEAISHKLIETFLSTLKDGFSVPLKSKEYQGYLCTALQPVFNKLVGKITVDVADSFADHLIESFKARGAVYDEGLLAISGLINCMGKSFTGFMKKLGPYIMFSLRNTEDLCLCRAAIGCIGDLSRALESLIQQYLGEIVPIVMNLIKSEETERNIKLIIITTLGDLALAANKSYTPFLTDSLEMLKSAAALSLQSQQDVRYIKRDLSIIG
jgi:importin subunit beta-1